VTGVILCALVLAAGCSTSSSPRLVTRHVSLVADRYAVDYWTSQVAADSQLVVTRDQDEIAATQALPPCAQTPAVDPPCTGFAIETAAKISAMIGVIGQSVEDAERQVTNDQLWLQAFQAKLKKDEGSVETRVLRTVDVIRRASRPVHEGSNSVLLYGDSTALTLGLALGDWTSESGDGLNVINESQIGCGIAEGTFVVSAGSRADLPTACNSQALTAEQWPAILAREVALYRPAVVALLAGRWEVYDRAGPGGQVTNITQRSYALYVERELQQFVRIASKSGSHVLLMTAPYYDPPEDSGRPLPPEDNPIRVSDYNRLLSAVVRANPGTTSLFDLNAIVSPHGRYALEVGHQLVRAPDGVHFPFFGLYHGDDPDPDTAAQVAQFSRWIGPRVVPSIERAARRSAAEG
jgi:hypothetical protein